MKRDRNRTEGGDHQQTGGRPPGIPPLAVDLGSTAGPPLPVPTARPESDQAGWIRRYEAHEARHHRLGVYVEGTAPLPLANDDYPVKRTDFCEGQFVHACLLRASYTRRVGWPTQ